MFPLHDFLHHPIETLERALRIRKQIDQLNAALKEVFGPSPVSLGGVQTNAPKKRGRPRKISVIVPEGITESEPTITRPKKKRKMSAAAKAKIAAAQRARWAKQKGTAGPATAVVMEGPKRQKKRGISAAGRARIAAAQRARWAKVKAEKDGSSRKK